MITFAGGFFPQFPYADRLKNEIKNCYLFYFHCPVATKHKGQSPCRKTSCSEMGLEIILGDGGG